MSDSVLYRWEITAATPNKLRGRERFCRILISLHPLIGVVGSIKVDTAMRFIEQKYEKVGRIKLRRKGLSINLFVSSYHASLHQQDSDSFLSSSTEASYFSTFS